MFMWWAVTITYPLANYLVSNLIGKRKKFWREDIWSLSHVESEILLKGYTVLYKQKAELDSILCNFRRHENNR
jgi:hypothetical protein